MIITEEQLHREVMECLSCAGALDCLRQLLARFRDSGGSRGDAIKVLEALRAVVSDDEEDFLLEALDYAAGFCPPDREIWK